MIETEITVDPGANQLRGRFKDLPWFANIKKHPVFLAGAGGIGSWTALMLTRAGATVYVIDPDTIETHNIGGQFYTVGDVGNRKVIALRNRILEDNGETIEFDTALLQDIYDDSKYFLSEHSIWCAAFDNMEARRFMFEEWKKAVGLTYDRMLFIDGRMLAEGGQIFIVDSDNPKHVKEYEKTLFEDADVENQPCTARATSHSGCLIGSLITSIITNWVTNTGLTEQGLVAVRDVPFAVRYELPLLMINTYDNAESFN